MTEDEMVGWHHRLSGHEFEQTPGDSGGLRSLACRGPWGCRVTQDLANEQQEHNLWARNYYDKRIPFDIEGLCCGGHFFGDNFESEDG